MIEVEGGQIFEVFFKVFVPIGFNNMLEEVLHLTNVVNKDLQDVFYLDLLLLRIPLVVSDAITFKLFEFLVLDHCADNSPHEGLQLFH